MHARRLPRLNSEPFHREDYDKSSLGKGKFRTYSNHRSESPDSEGTNSMYSEGLSRSKDYKYRKSKSRDDRNDRNRDRSPREKYYKDKSRDKEVERLTNFGDWSEHKSSTGKRYYYNCNTEVSQWEKPREWLDYERSLARQNYHEKRSSDWTDRGGGGEGRSGGGGDNRNENSRGGETRTEVRSVEDNNGLSRPNPAKIHCDRSLRGSQDKHNSCSPQQLHRGRSHTERSGDATPTSEGEGGNSREGGGGVVNNSSHYTPGGAVSLSAVIPRISSQHTSMSNRERWDSPRSNVSQSPPSTSSEQTLTQAVMSPLQQLQTPVVTLTPSLAKLYKEDLIHHVQSWPAEQLERGCHRLEEEAHQISSHGITRVSAELKMARSLVRLAEIQATLQEQRILFLRQQMIDMERHQPASISHHQPTTTLPGLLPSQLQQHTQPSTILTNNIPDSTANTH